jgi:hypothetical protein
MPMMNVDMDVDMIYIRKKIKIALNCKLLKKQKHLQYQRGHTPKSPAVTIVAKNGN